MTRFTILPSIGLIWLFAGLPAQADLPVTVQSLRAEHAAHAARLRAIQSSELVTIRFLNTQQYESQLPRAI